MALVLSLDFSITVYECDGFWSTVTFFFCCHLLAPWCSLYTYM